MEGGCVIMCEPFQMQRQVYFYNASAHSRGQDRFQDFCLVVLLFRLLSFLSPLSVNLPLCAVIKNYQERFWVLF